MTDTKLIRAVIAAAGGIMRVDEDVTLPSRVTLWRWLKVGVIPNQHQRAVLSRYLADHLARTSETL